MAKTEKDIAERFWAYYCVVIKNAGAYITPYAPKNPEKDEDLKVAFVQLFCAKYRDFMRRFMGGKTEALDSHKVAALGIISLLSLRLLEKNRSRKTTARRIPTRPSGSRLRLG